jgi:hypothetical protein
MSHCSLHFLGELNDFLTPEKRELARSYPVGRRASVKDVIEALGPPHPEVGRIERNGSQLGFEHILQPEERLAISPHPKPIQVTQKSLLCPKPLSGVRFVVDVNVGKLARHLRMLGYDAAYHWTWRDRDIAHLAESEGRIVLTQDIGLLKRRQVVWGRYIRSKQPEEQLLEVVRVFGLEKPFALLTRCLDCNRRLEPVDKEAILHRLEPKTKRYFDTFRICPGCDRIYWPGSHQERMLQWLEELGLA